MGNIRNITSRSSWYVSDAAFDWLYPQRIQKLSMQHWTPMEVAKRSAGFLATGDGKRILDIGSGVGKFCLIGGYHFPEATFYGIEQRKELYHYARAAKELTEAKNVEFIHGNFTQIDFEDFDHFYFYNAFFENLVEDGQIDQQIEYSSSLYNYYARYMYKGLDSKPSGTRLVTFHSLEDEIPPSYQLVDATVDFLLKMWVKR
ncbi:class I SAM-dependent methyltransferase [Chitinophaga filiformis]|uniref:Class I SAM-dependent methyltransferase n=1 Tax=Chitinophaga filiformis TaxID=104663 RepID=A0ABY4I531_CHIFI|nr:class I SAM-dependent methyltransferase [Chitinophaga filiformis]UPK71196.1 class I SAM-dependent methyltransferase [Chitinophaga filiformis]